MRLAYNQPRSLFNPAIQERRRLAPHSHAHCQICCRHLGGPGQPGTTDGNTDSTVVEFTARGKVVHQWDLRGKCDGITGDTQRGVLIATVNEDANSSVYTIRPGAPKSRQITHYS